MTAPSQKDEEVLTHQQSVSHAGSVVLDDLFSLRLPAFPALGSQVVGADASAMQSLLSELGPGRIANAKGHRISAPPIRRGSSIDGGASLSFEELDAQTLAVREERERVSEHLRQALQQRASSRAASRAPS